MNVNTGAIISMVSLPDFDLNKRALIKDNIFTNKITLGVYELGSVFKTFTIAAGLENNVIDKNTIFQYAVQFGIISKTTIKTIDKAIRINR